MVVNTPAEIRRLEMFIILELAPQLRLGDCTIPVFFDDRFVEVTFNRGAVKTMEEEGSEYFGGIVHVVDTLLGRQDVRVFGLGSKDAYNYMKASGIFEYDGTVPVKYHRSGKTWDVF